MSYLLIRTVNMAIKKAKDKTRHLTEKQNQMMNKEMKKCSTVGDKRLYYI